MTKTGAVVFYGTSLIIGLALGFYVLEPLAMKLMGR